MRIYRFDDTNSQSWFVVFSMFSLSLTNKIVMCVLGKNSSLPHDQLIYNGAIEKEMPLDERLRLIRFLFSKIKMF